MGNVSFDASKPQHDASLMQRGEQFVKSHGLHVRPDPSGRSGYRLFTGTDKYGVFVDVPVLEEDHRNRLIASHTLENAMDSIVFRAGEVSVWAH
jgi:hypothetical protein